MPLFEIDVVEAVNLYVSGRDTTAEETLRELHPTLREALEREMTIMSEGLDNGKNQFRNNRGPSVG